MNGNYYQNPTFPNNATSINMEIPNNINTMQTNLPTIKEKNNLISILKLNNGKRINAYVSFSNNSDWQNKTFFGIIENTGDDYVYISEPTTNNWYLIKLDNLDYIEFMEKINL